MSDQVKKIRKANLIEALISFFGLIVIMAIGIMKFHVDPHVPMFLGVIVAACVSLYIGYSWEQIEESMIHGITQALQSVLILAIIGILIGVWMVSGVVPSMIYYGLNILSPKIFLPATMIICSITSLATGTSWGTAGTMGIALMGIAQGLGIPAPITAGAVLSGAYFGDKMSPLSDTTNLAPAMAGTDVFTHVKFMLKATVVTYVITIVAFTVIGLRYGAGEAELSSIVELQQAIADQFKVSPLLLLPPVVVIVTIAKKMPAIPGITIGILVAGIMSPIFQGADGGFGALLDCGMNGYVSETGNEAVDALLSKGGLMNMMFSISMTIIAMMFGGIVEMTGQMEVIVNNILKLVKSDAGLVVATEATCILSNATMPEQYISIVVPGRMYAKAYQDRGLHPKTLSNALESAGTVSGALIPWNTCGVFMSETLGLPVYGKIDTKGLYGAAGQYVPGYAPWAIFNYLMIIITAVMAFMGITVAKMTEEEKKILAETGRVS
ncbi:MAG: Na+/H+ antiporter NhaC [Filifactor alocis]|nr:Na+/H+ antiporter NhaC [Filifactor alocis]